MLNKYQYTPIYEYTRIILVLHLFFNIRNLFPENLVGAWLHQTGSEYKLRANAPATSHSAPFSSSSSLFTSLSSAWSHTNFNSIATLIRVFYYKM